MHDWPMLAGVSALMITGYVGAAWTLRDVDNPGPVRKAGRRSVTRPAWLRRRLGRLTRAQRLGVLWGAVIATGLFTRAVFALAAAAHTEQGVILGALALGTLFVAAVATALNSLKQRIRRVS